MQLDNVSEFSEDNTINEFKTFIKTLPKQIEFNEIATKNKQDKNKFDVTSFENATEESLKIYNQAKLMSEKDDIFFRDALLKLQS